MVPVSLCGMTGVGIGGSDGGAGKASAGLETFGLTDGCDEGFWIGWFVTGCLRRFEDIDREMPITSINPLKKATTPTITIIQSKRFDGIWINRDDFLPPDCNGVFSEVV